MNRDNIIIFDKSTKKSRFPWVSDTNSKIEEYRKSANYLILEVGDTVTFQGHAHLEDDGESKVKTGIVKRVGWVPGYANPQIVCGIKVEGEKFGSALPYNYTMHPVSLTKTQ